MAVHCGAHAGASTTAGSSASQNSVLLEQLSSSELRERIAAGSTTVIVPVGGTEQSGPYLALGKHNVRAQYLAQQIALKLGHTIVAPVIAYVPEGEIKPPSGHMRFSGTISIPEATFEALLDATARSLRQHGFRDVIFIGDHGGYQKNLSKVAQQFNRSWAADDSCRAYALLDYYQASQTGYVADLKSRGYSEAEIGLHAGLADTALMLAVDKTMVRSDAMAHQPKPGPADGVQGDPRRASAELGQLGLQRIIDASVSRLHTYLTERAARATSTSSHRN
ncbi:creatininase family protein [Pseudoduganella sp. CY13W]|uniref:Creatininase family protein n=2 Tax=Duganella qianjiadongensis TaxID=2692176 RepID=A0ABW9VEY7_9BURK|nr:creatininase family protein [Duganella qianjiadongensis]